MRNDFVFNCALRITNYALYSEDCHEKIFRRGGQGARRKTLRL
jgi:hypothetical protein